ncbi:hypothetical protein BH20ACT2_BH20ACT2_20840 [soil metagenome]
MAFALQSEHVTMWWITLGLGFVVVVVVIVLLSLLVSLVNDIDRNVSKAWSTATNVARNTATTWMLQRTATSADVLHHEVERHARLLNEKAGAP